MDCKEISSVSLLFHPDLIAGAFHENDQKVPFSRATETYNLGATGWFYTQEQTRVLGKIQDFSKNLSEIGKCMQDALIGIADYQKQIDSLKEKKETKEKNDPLVDNDLKELKQVKKSRRKFLELFDPLCPQWHAVKRNFEILAETLKPTCLISSPEMEVLRVEKENIEKFFNLSIEVPFPFSDLHSLRFKKLINKTVKDLQVEKEHAVEKEKPNEAPSPFSNFQSSHLEKLLNKRESNPQAVFKGFLDLYVAELRKPPEGRYPNLLNAISAHLENNKKNLFFQTALALFLNSFIHQEAGTFTKNCLRAAKRRVLIPFLNYYVEKICYLDQIFILSNSPGEHYYGQLFRNKLISSIQRADASPWQIQLILTYLHHPDQMTAYMQQNCVFDNQEKSNAYENMLDSLEDLPESSLMHFESYPSLVSEQTDTSRLLENDNFQLLIVIDPYAQKYPVKRALDLLVGMASELLTPVFKKSSTLESIFDRISKILEDLIITAPIFLISKIDDFNLLPNAAFNFTFVFPEDRKRYLFHIKSGDSVSFKLSNHASNISIRALLSPNQISEKSPEMKGRIKLDFHELEADENYFIIISSSMTDYIDPKTNGLSPQEAAICTYPVEQGLPIEDWDKLKDVDQLRHYFMERYLEDVLKRNRSEENPIAILQNLVGEAKITLSLSDDKIENLAIHGFSLNRQAKSSLIY